MPFFSYEPRKDGSWNVKEGRKKLLFSRDEIKMLIFVEVLHEFRMKLVWAFERDRCNKIAPT